MSDWSPLSDGDPVPGSPPEVRRLAQRLGNTASVLGTQTARLRSMSADQFWSGSAADGFRSLQEKLPPQLDKVRDRYGRTSAALSAFAGKLESAQSMAAQALVDARAADAAMRAARRGLEQWSRSCEPLDVTRTCGTASIPASRPGSPSRGPVRITPPR